MRIFQNKEMAKSELYVSLKCGYIRIEVSKMMAESEL
jgi:hypothetical protein